MQNTIKVTTSAEQNAEGPQRSIDFGGQEVETKRFDKVSKPNASSGG